MKSKCIAYCRVSTDEQESSGLGLESQQDKVIGYAKLYDIELLDIIQDAGSGKNMKREGLQKALSMLRNGDAEGIIIAKLDRLTRSVRDMGELLETYFTKDYCLHVVDEKIDTGTASGRMMVNILMSVAQWERETIAERTKAALTVKRKKHEKCGGIVPFGYVLDSDTSLLVEHHAEQKAIRLIRRLKAKSYSLRAICRELEKEGHPTKTGRPTWHPQIVKQIITNSESMEAMREAA